MEGAVAHAAGPVGNTANKAVRCPLRTIGDRAVSFTSPRGSELRQQCLIKSGIAASEMGCNDQFALQKT